MVIDSVYVTNVEDEYKIDLQCTVEDMRDILDALEAKNANYGLNGNQMRIAGVIERFFKHYEGGLI